MAARPSHRLGMAGWRSRASAPEDCYRAARPDELLLEVVKLVVVHDRLVIIVEGLQAQALSSPEEDTVVMAEVRQLNSCSLERGDRLAEV